MSRIIDIKAREILDSNGNPTIETDVLTEKGGFGRASIPSGASVGENEVIELRDNDNRFLGKGVLKAVKNVNEKIKKELLFIDVCNQEEIDKRMIILDGTETKNNLGANAILSVSLACLKAAANENNMELYEYLGKEYSMPYPMMNILNGGKHASNKLDFQEFMIIPQQSNIKERIRCGSEVFHNLKNILQENGYSTSVGYEGGFAPNLSSNEEALDYIVESIIKSGYKPGVDVKLALDVAASEIYNPNDNLYYFNNERKNSRELINYYEELIKKYPIASIEDPFEQSDFDSFHILTKKIGDIIDIVGDDFFVTNEEYLKRGIKVRAGNAIIIKLNQVGTVTETLETIKLARKNNFKTIISHRSGETDDTYISDIAVGLNLGYIKTGSLSRMDRVSKYNRLLRIYEDLNK